MLSSEIKNSIKEVVEEVYFDEPMKKHTTFKIGGPADAFCIVKSIDELVGLVKLCRNLKIEYMTVGNGSNMLVGDGGIRGVVIKQCGDFLNVSIEGTKVVAGSGVLLSKLCNGLLKASLTGLEFAAGIPGCVGGGVYMNAGAYEGMLSQCIKSVSFIDEDGEPCKKNADELDFSYRHSYFSDKNCIITECEFELKKGNAEEISAKMTDYNKRRSEKQPLDMPSAGSTFKRPEGYFAGKLIQDSNLMGYSVGGASVSEKHAGFVINKDNATAADVLNLIEYIKKVVYEKFGVELHEEVRLIGEK